MRHIGCLEVSESKSQLVQNILDYLRSRLWTLLEYMFESIETALLARLKKEVDCGVIGTEDVVDELNDCAMLQCLQDEDRADKHSIFAPLLDVIAVIALQSILFP